MRAGDVLRRRRQIMGLTQRALAEKSGVNALTICRIEKGRDEDGIFLSTARKLTEALGMTLDELVAERESN